MVVVLAVLAVVVVVVAVALTVVARRGMAEARARTDAALAGVAVERRAKAKFYGLASHGDAQVRGLGTLALTAEHLVFVQAVPAREVRISRAAVTYVEVARSFLGKTQAGDLLLVTWTTTESDSGEERAGFDVPEIDTWRVALLTGPAR